VRSRGKTALAAGAILAFLAVPAGGRSTPARTPLLLVALGDSTAYGRTYCGGCTTFVRRFARALDTSTRRRVRIENLAEPHGLDSAGLLRELRSDSAIRAVVARADAVTITVGHDDTPWESASDDCDGPATYPLVDWDGYGGDCLNDNLNRYSTNLESILALVRDLRGGKRTLVRVTIPYNDLIGRRALPRLGAEISQQLAEDYAVSTCQAAIRYAADCIDVLHLFNGLSGFRPANRFLARDHTNPNARGHLAIAHLLIRAGFAPFRRR
jgi:lysophospholipase L1-like esterase